MTPSRKKLVLMERKRRERCLQRQSEERTGTHLLEQVSVGRIDEEGDSMTKNLLIEAMPSNLTLIESKGDKIIARGEFGRVDVPTQNGRIYPAKLIEREIGRLSEDLGSRRVLGELDHPENGKTSLKRVSHVITDLKIKDGIVVGECEILNTPEGKTLKALIEAGIPVGVSSRGFGSTRPATGNLKGDVVQEDFVLKTYDFVADPAMKSAVPSIYTEDVDDETIAQMFMKEFPEIAEGMKSSDSVLVEGSKSAVATGIDREAVRKELSENFEKKLAASLILAKEELTKEIKESYDSDPTIGGAKAVLSQIAEIVGAYRAVPAERVIRDALKAKDVKIAEAMKENKTLKMSLVLEKAVAGHHMADSLRKLVRVESFDTEEELVEAVQSVVSKYPTIGDSGFVSESDVRVREENVELKGKISLLESKVEELNGKLRKVAALGERIDKERQDALRRVEEIQEEYDERLESALNEAKEAEEAKIIAEEKAQKLEMEIYKREKVAKLSNGRQVMSLLEDVDSKEAVDKLVEDKSVNRFADGELERMRSEVRRGRVHSLNEDSGNGAAVVQDVKDLQVLGLPSMREMREMAGIK